MSKDYPIRRMRVTLPLKNLNIEYVDLRQEPTRITVQHNINYTTDEEV